MTHSYNAINVRHRMDGNAIPYIPNWVHECLNGLINLTGFIDLINWQKQFN